MSNEKASSLTSNLPVHPDDDEGPEYWQSHLPGTTLYSLIETAKANGLDPYQYLLYLFDKLPSLDGDNMCDDQLRTLLPLNLTSEILAE